MRVVVQKSLLLEALKKVAQFSGKKFIFETVNIIVKEREMTLSATDGATYATIEIDELTTHTIGAIATKIKDLSSFLSKVKADSIELNTEDNSVLVVTAATIQYRIDSVPADQFPMPPNEQFNSFTLPVAEYARILNNTVYAVASSESRPVLQGVNISTQNKRKTIQFAATDSHRLGIYELNQPMEFEFNVSPAGETLNKTLKVLNKNTTTIQIGISTRYTRIQFDNMEIYVRNSEGNYPDTSRLIPDSFVTTIEIDAKEAIETLSVLKSIAKNVRNNTVSMTITDQIELKASNETSSMNALLTGETSGEELRITYDLPYMMDALKALDEKKVTLNFCGSNRPVIIESKSSPAKHLILPVRTV